MIADGKTYGRGLPWPQSIIQARYDAGGNIALAAILGVQKDQVRRWCRRKIACLFEKTRVKLTAGLAYTDAEMPAIVHRPKPWLRTATVICDGACPVGYPSRGDVIVETLLKQVGQMTAKMPYAPVPPLFPKHYDILDILCDSFRLTDEAIEAARLAFCEPDRQRVPVGEPMESAGVAPAALVAATHPSV